MEIIIGKTQDGMTVGQILKQELGLSHAIVTSLKKRPDGILLDGSHATVRNIVHYGNSLSVHYHDTVADTENSSVRPIPMLLDILYEDTDIIVVNKPPNMPTHPSHEHQSDTLANGLAYHAKRSDKPYIIRLVNRLDANTSGLVLVAKNKLAAYRLSESMKTGKIHKSYFAVLCGSFEMKSGEFDGYMAREQNGKMRRRLCQKEDAGAMRALTRYRTVIQNDMFCGVLAAPITGRTHQLRVQFSGFGHPICGDTLYGYPIDLIGRQALHAVRLSFPHPSNGRTVRFDAPLPHDIAALCKAVFGNDEISL